MGTGIIGIGRYVPETVYTNEYFEQRLDTSDEWIRTRTGIEERRFASDEENTSDLAIKATEKALKNANITMNDIGLIVVATATPDQVFPTVACQIGEHFGVKCAAMDISAACSGFIYGLVTASQYIENNTYEHVLVVGVEKLSKITNFEDRNTAILFGDGACAAVLSKVSDGRGILSFDLGSDGSGGEFLFLNDEQFIDMKGREVFKFAVRQMGDSAVQVLEKAGLQKEDCDFLVPHQANIRIIEAARERLGLPSEKVSITVNKYGNTSAASIGLSLVEELEQGKIKDDDILVLVGFGGGLTWGSIALKWGK